MKIVALTTQRDKRRFIDFIYSLYKGDGQFVDTSVFITKIFLYGTDSFSAECTILPMQVREHDKPVAQCMFIAHSDFPYLQMGFFDALPDRQAAVDMLVQRSREEAFHLGKPAIIIGLNGHVSYGVGIQTGGFGKKISFDSLYNKEYYGAYFEGMRLERHGLTTYAFEPSRAAEQLDRFKGRNSSFSFRTLDKRRFKEEMLLFGALCNTCLHETFLYFDRKPQQMYELMCELKFFLRPENLIFVLENGREVGFVLWHPDYNEVLKPGVKNSFLKIAFRFFFGQSGITTAKVNAIGILPEFQRSWAVAGLLNEGLRLAKNKFTRGETNFVWDNNKNSVMLNRGLHNKAMRTYCVYTAPV